MSTTKINLVLFGIGTIGSSLIKKIIEQQQYLLEEKSIELVLAIITNSTLAFFEREDQKNRWDADFTKSPAPFTIQNIIDYTKEAELENLIAIDATNSTEILNSYDLLLENNFDILSVNKNSKIQEPDFYEKFSKSVEKADMNFANQQDAVEKIVETLLEISKQYTTQDLQIA